MSSISSSKEKNNGVSRNLSMRYIMIREKMNIHYNKKNNIKSYFNDNNNDKFTSQLISSNDRIELQNLQPPRYMDMYEQCNNLLQDLEIEFNKLKEEQQKRIVPSFDETNTKLINR